MRRQLLTIALVFSVAIATQAADVRIYRPDPVKTPGVVFTHRTATICVPHYTESVRNVPATVARQVFAQYGIGYSQHSLYEVDHLISLELGGSNEAANLWPQRYCPPAVAGRTCFGAREKDAVENELHRRVCAGTLSLAEAQWIIVTDWYAEYVRYKQHKKIGDS